MGAAEAKHINSCAKQHPCMDVTMEVVESNVCGANGGVSRYLRQREVENVTSSSLEYSSSSSRALTPGGASPCDWKVCMTWNFDKTNCVKGTTQTITNVCSRSADYCSEAFDFSTGNLKDNVSDGHQECVIAKQNSPATFLVRDKKCKASSDLMYGFGGGIQGLCFQKSIAGSAVQDCNPNSVNGNNQECFWQFTTPKCPTPPPTPSPSASPSVSSEPSASPSASPSISSEPSESPSSSPSISSEPTPPPNPPPTLPLLFGPAPTPLPGSQLAPPLFGPAPTPLPAAETNPPASNSGKVVGDPHIKTWTGQLYDFHGVCDLVMLQNPDFKAGLGMDIHIRTKRTLRWSYISSAVLRIGKETLEIMGGSEDNKYWINGVQGGELTKLSGFAVTQHAVHRNQREFRVELNGEKEYVLFKAFKDMIMVSVENGSADNFGRSLGLLGSFGKGEKKARDNLTIIEDNNEFGQEWQVGSDEDKLFHNLEGPQAPEKCELASTQQSIRRRLGESKLTLDDAETACSRVPPEDFDICVFDVLATDDSEIAGVYEKHI